MSLLRQIFGSAPFGADRVEAALTGFTTAIDQLEQGIAEIDEEQSGLIEERRALYERLDQVDVEDTKLRRHRNRAEGIKERLIALIDADAKNDEW